MWRMAEKRTFQKGFLCTKAADMMVLALVVQAYLLLQRREGLWFFSAADLMDLKTLAVFMVSLHFKIPGA
ncbi:hypothetical protein CLOM_g13010 [Closterium sp. NIES-68]|nr:hypothetical protein CLOM_g13010 [Closterium sp. NIES-68]GJP76318.1 hypothetical protein CLOP_g6781 [Closterium sp. NIES-67]